MSTKKIGIKHPLSYRPEGIGSGADLITRSVSEAKPFTED
jgi:hypothetical protein